MKHLVKLLGLIIIFQVTFLQKSIAQNTSCFSSQDTDIFLATLILTNDEIKEERVKIGIGSFNYIANNYSTEDSLFVEKIIQYWKNNSVRIIKEEADCNVINSLLAKSKVEQTLPGPLKKTYFKVRNTYMVVFQHDCGEGCVKIGGEKLPVLIIDKEGDIHELMRL
ncbi:MAG: hypothetical protein RLN81_05070 [Balneolaceae bacterium]